MILEKCSVLIISAQPSHRSSLRKTLIDLGATANLIEICPDYNLARERLAKTPVNIIICDEDVGHDHKGIDVLELHRKNNPEGKTRIFFLMLNIEVTPFILADFILRGGDMALSKPFKNEKFISIFMNIFATRVKLTPEDIYRFDLQDALYLGEMAKAKEMAQAHPESLAQPILYSKGLYFEAAQQLNDAFESLQKIPRTKIDFRSLVSILRIGVKTKKHVELLPFIEYWLKNIPLHHDSIPDITRVIIVNEKFDLLEELFQIFAAHNFTDQFIKIPLAAGFAMVAMKHFEKEEYKKAVEYAHKSVENSCQKLPILSKAIEIMVKSGAKKDAEAVYLKVTPELLSFEDHVQDIKIRSFLYDQTKILSECMKYLKDKKFHPDIFKTAIECVVAMNKNPEDLIIQAKRLYPTEDFSRIPAPLKKK